MLRSIVAVAFLCACGPRPGPAPAAGGAARATGAAPASGAAAAPATAPAPGGTPTSGTAPTAGTAPASGTAPTSGTAPVVAPGLGRMELFVRDPAAVREFYQTIAGWQLEPEGDHLVAKTGGETVAVIRGLPAKAKAHWLVHLSIGDLDAKVAGLTKAGGTVEAAPAEVAGVGKVARVIDPNGARLALVAGAALAGQAHPGRWSWAEVWAPDPAAAARFYQAAIGWSTRDLKQGIMRYAFLEERGRARAGLSPIPVDKAAPQWVPFVTVPSVDEAVVTAKKIRGRVRLPPVLIEGVGRVAVLLDPAGALVGVVSR